MDSPQSDASEACGIGDYAARLADELRQLSIDVLVLDRREWDRVGTPGIIRRIRNYGPDIVHIQYPTIGYYRGFVLPILAAAPVFRMIVLTTHEFIQSHPFRRVCTNILAQKSIATIFPSDFERKVFLAHHPKLEARTFVIPIGSNIGAAENGLENERRPSSVLYFGQIRPNKGIEEFIRLVEEASGNPHVYSFCLVGTPHPRHKGYYQALRDRTSSLPIEWFVGLSEDEVRKILSSRTYAYLPFPDGASERRGSLLAVLSNGLAVLTTKGDQTPAGLQHAVAFVSGTTHALEMLDSFEKDASMRREMVVRAREYSKSFSWGQIAANHYELYKKMAGGQH